jgi:hypothetical protein
MGRLVVVASPADFAARGAEDPQDGSHENEQDSGRPQDGDVEQEREKEQDDAERNHDSSAFCYEQHRRCVASTRVVPVAVTIETTHAGLGGKSGPGRAY